MLVGFGCSPLAMARDAYVFGKGTNSCGEYSLAAENERKLRPLQANPASLYSVEFEGYAQYALGFLSGENMADDSNSVVGFNQTPIVILTWLDDYCSRNPTDGFVRALVVLRRQLIQDGR
jgi:hypothetical protein